jgi:O-antigen/teichoic acid export membrane protein
MGRLLVRRSLTAVGIYSSVVLGFLATVVAAHQFHSKAVFGLYGIVFAATGFFQTLLDLTVEEAVVKFGFAYAARKDWGRLRELVRKAFLVKLAGGVLGALGLVVVAPFADALFHHHGLETALFVAAGIPLIQSLEGLAGAVLFLRGRYDIRSAFLISNMALRLAAVWLGAPHGLVRAVTLVVLAQAVATASIGVVGIAALQRFPRAERVPLDDRRDIVWFVLQSSLATGVISIRNFLTPLALGIATTSTQVGYYNVAKSPQSGFQALSAPARMVLLTEQTRDWEHGRRRAVMRGIRNYSLLAAATMVVAVPLLYAFMPDLIKLIFHAQYLPASNAARIFVVAAAVQFLVGWTKSFPVTIGRPGLRILTHGVESAVVVPLTVIFGLAWGATGAAAAVLVGSCVFAAMWAVIAIRVDAVDVVPT